MARSSAAIQEGIEPETLTADEQAAMDADRAAEGTAAAEDVPSLPNEGTLPADGGETEPATDGQPAARQGMVPHAALHEAREKLKSAEARAAEAERKERLLEERTNLILQRFTAPPAVPTQPAPQAPAIPSFEEDPAGHILGQVRQQGAILGELVQAVTGQARQSEASQGVQQLTVRAAAMEREFATANPDYDKASSHLFEMRRQELMAAGWTDPAEIQTMMANEATGLAARAIQQGRNPAEVVYQLAKLRGYVPPAAESGNGAANGTTPPGGEAQLRTIAAGQQQARTVGSMPGSVPAPLTAARLLELSDDEFAEKWAKNPTEMRNLMGA
jgi:hypothetical protein